MIVDLRLDMYKMSWDSVWGNSHPRSSAEKRAEKWSVRKVMFLTFGKKHLFPLLDVSITLFLRYVLCSYLTATKFSQNPQYFFLTFYEEHTHG